MRINLGGVVQFPCDAESDSFFSALASALMPVLGYTEETPFYCSPNGRYCIDCGQCGKAMLQRHHLSLYHALLAATGAAFGFDYPEDDDVPYHTLPCAETGWRWPDDFVDIAMQAAGVDWERLTHAAGEQRIYGAIVKSIDAGRPVLVRLGGKGPFPGDTAWQVITGYDGSALLGLDSRAHSLAERAAYEGDLFVLRDWYETFSDAIVISNADRKPMAYVDMLQRIVSVLECENHARCERDIIGMLDSVREDNADRTAAALCGIAGVPIEARWHAAEAFCSKDNLLTHMTGSDACHDALAELLFTRYIANDRGETHGACWRIWGILGADASTGFMPAADAGSRLMDEHTRAELKRLYERVFDNDRAALVGIKAVLARENQAADIKS